MKIHVDYELNPEQQVEYDRWVKEQNEKACQKQRDNLPFTLRGLKDAESYLPWYGCTGEGYTYLITPTSLGLCIVVRNNVTMEELDLSQWDNI